MRFSGQKFFILLGIFLIPILFVGALLREPVVNRGLLRITLSILKERMGTSLKAQTWKLDLSKFAVAVEGVEFTRGKLTVTVKDLRAEFSPLFLLIGRVYLSKVWASEVMVRGEVNLPDKAKDDTPLDIEKEISDAANVLTKIQDRMDSKKIGFEVFELSTLKVDTNLIKIANGDMKVENFGYGHVKAEFDVEKIQGNKRVPDIERMQASVVLYKDRNSAYLSVRNLNAELQNKDFLHTTFELKGRLPGDVSLDFMSDLSELKKWMIKQSVPKLHSFAEENNFGGYIELRGVGQVAGAGLKRGELNFKGRKLIWSDMSLAQIAGTVEVKEKEWKVAKVSGRFNGTRLDKNFKNEFNGKDLVFENDRVEGDIQLDHLGLCALLRGVGVKDCQLDLVMKGHVELGGQLKPLKIVPKLDITTEPFEVYTEADFADVPASGRLLKARPAHVTGSLEVNDTELVLSDVRARFSEAAAIEARGNIKLSPTRVFLQISTEKTKIGDMIFDFLTLPANGLLKADVTVDYDVRRLKENGRTDFFADYLIRDLQVAELPLGDATGKLQFTKKILEFKPTIRMGPGTLKVAGQIGRLDPSIAGSQLSIYADALDYEILIPRENGSPVFDGVATFETHLSGSLADNSSRPFSGRIKADLHSMTSFGIPFEKGEVNAFVDMNGFKIEKLVAYKGDSKTELTGFVGPKGARVDFSSDFVPIRQVGFEPTYEKLAQNGEIKIGGWWDRLKGWALEGQTRNLKIGNSAFPPANLRFEGDKQGGFFANIDSGDEVKFRYDSKEESFRGKLKDSGIFLAMTLINKWERVPEFLKVQGDVDVAWSKTLGQIDLNDLDIQVTDRFNQQDRQLIKLKKRAQIIYQDGNFRGNAELSSGLGNFAIKSAGSELGAHGQLSVRLFDLFLPDFLRLIDGFASIDVKWSPRIANSLRALVSVENATAYMPVVGAELRAVNGNVRYENQKILFEGINGRSGESGDFTLSGDMQSDASRINLRTHLSSVGMRTGREADLILSGDLNIEGSDKPFFLRGKVRIEKGILRKEFNGSGIKTAILEKPFMNFDVPFEIMPAFQVKNSLADAFITGKGRLLGNDLNPVIAGRFDVVKGTLLAKDNEFTINFARVQLPEDPNFDPVNVNVQASTIKNYQGIDYRIFLVAEGDPNELNLNFRSEPSLSQRETIALLTLGYVPIDQPVSGQGSTIAQSASAEAFQLLFGQALGKGIQKQTGFDVRVGTSANLKQEDTIPKVSVYRKLGDRMSATFGRSLDVSRPENNFKIDYRLLKNLNLTGVWENPEENRHSLGLDLRLNFEIK
jgi:hypothetical protein